MTTDKNKLNILITLSQYYLFSKSQRRANSVNIHHINIMINLYIMERYLKMDKIRFNNIVSMFNYFNNTRLKVIMGNIIPDYVVLYDSCYYRLSDRGIGLVEDILNSYDLVFRTFLEKHKLNELF